MGGEENEDVYDLTLNQQGEVLMAGRFKKKAYFGATPFQTKGTSSNGFVAKYGF